MADSAGTPNAIGRTVTFSDGTAYVPPTKEGEAAASSNKPRVKAKDPSQAGSNDPESISNEEYQKRLDAKFKEVASLDNEVDAAHKAVIEARGEVDELFEQANRLGENIHKANAVTTALAGILAAVATEGVSSVALVVNIFTPALNGSSVSQTLVDVARAAPDVAEKAGLEAATGGWGFAARGVSVANTAMDLWEIRKTETGFLPNIENYSDAQLDKLGDGLNKWIADGSYRQLRMPDAKTVKEKVAKYEEARRHEKEVVAKRDAARNADVAPGLRVRPL